MRQVEEKPTYNNLYEANQRLEAIFKTSSDGIITINEQGIIESINNAALQLFGYDKAELVGQNINKLMPSPHHENHDQYLSNYLTTRVKKIIGIGREVIAKKKNGTLIPIRLAVSKVLLKDKTIFTGITHDLTDRKKAEQIITQLNTQLEQKVTDRTEQLAETVNQLLQSNKLLKEEISKRKETENQLQLALEKERELGELKTRFITMASHEFRTPLTTILSSIELMTKYTQTNQQGKREKHAQKITNAVNGLNEVLNDFMLFKKLDEDQIDLLLESFSLPQLLEDIKSKLTPHLKLGQSLLIENKSEQDNILLDRQLLKNILNNLLSNSIKYSQKNKPIHLRLHSHLQNLIIRVEDQGIGIPINDQPHLFSKFFRGDNAQNIPGTGLGLTIVKLHLDQLKGQISFSSKEYRGTTFTIQIPLNKGRNQ